MTKRYTRKNKNGIKTKSTLLTAVSKMTNLHKRATATRKRTGSSDNEGTLNKMLMWLSAVEKCPPRHYGKVWNDEKEIIVRQCRDMYLDAQKFSDTGSDFFMGRADGDAGSSRFMGLDRLRFNMATAKWDFTHSGAGTGSDPYWMPHKNYMAYTGKPVKVLKGPEKTEAYQHHLWKCAKYRGFGSKVTEPYSEWTPGEPRWK